MIKYVHQAGESV